jgi:uncharacterized membrane protein
MENINERRIWELDFLRGFSIIMMIWDHLMYDFLAVPYWYSNYFSVNNSLMESLSEFAESYWSSELRSVGHWVFIGFFLLVSGISFTFSRSNAKRGLKFLLFALLISAVTFTLEALTGLPTAIAFGIIHMFAVCTLLTFLARKLWNNDLFIFILGTIVLVVGIMFKQMSPIYISELTFENIWLVIVGYSGFGADSFGIFPYWGIILIGTVIGNILYKNKVSLLPGLDRSWHRPFTFVGRHSIIFFLAHQPIVLGLVTLFAIFLGYRF